MKKLRNVILMLTMLALFLGLAIGPTDVWADDSTTPPYEKAGSGERNPVDFAAGANLATVVIDRSKLTLSNAVIDPGTGYVLSGKSIVTKRQEFNKGEKYSFGPFKVTYKEAGILSDGTRVDLILECEKTTIFTRNGKMGEDLKNLAFPYFDQITVFNVETENGPSILGKSSTGRHAGLRMENFKISFSDPAPSALDGQKDTFFFTVEGLNVDRHNMGKFKDIYGADDNFSFDEAAQILKGYATGTSVFIPSSNNERIGNYNEGTEDNGFIMVANDNNYHRNVMNDESRKKNYDTGYAVLGQAGGLSFNFWTSVPNAGSTDFYILDDRITYTITSSSGYYGKIETAYDGTLDSINAGNGVLYGGRYVAGEGGVDQRRTYDVPVGKTVTYKMTPEDGYILDQLKVNGAPATPEAVYDTNGKIQYYTYTFPEGIEADVNQDIHVTWQPAVDVTMQKLWDDDRNKDGKRPASLNITLNQAAPAGAQTSYTLSEKDADASDSTGSTWTHVFHSLPKFTSYDEKTNTGTGPISYSFTEDPIPGYLMFNPFSTHESQDTTPHVQYYAPNHADTLNVRGFTEAATSYVKTAYTRYGEIYQIKNVYQRPTSINLKVAKKIDGRPWKDGDSFVFDLYQTLQQDTPLPGSPTVTVSYPKPENNCVFDQQDNQIVIGQTAAPIPLGWDLLYKTSGDLYQFAESVPGANVGDYGRILNIRVIERPLGKTPYKGFQSFGLEHSAHVVLVAETNSSGQLTGRLKAMVYYGEGWESGSAASKEPTAATFVNIYQAEPAKLSLTIHKLLNGKPAAGFRFVLKDNNGTGDARPAGIHMRDGTTVLTPGSVVWATAVSALGTYSGEVPVIEFTEPGTFKFILEEEVDADRVAQGITYDGKKVDITVTVTDNAEGKLVSVVGYSTNADPQDEKNKKKYPSYIGNSATFENTYDSRGTATISATKALGGRRWTNSDSFKFVLTPENGAPMRVMNGSTEVSEVSLSATATMNSKTFTFSELIFHLSDLGDKKEREFTYKLHEDWTSGDKGITPAADQVIRIQLSDPNGNGTMTVKYAKPGTSGDSTIWLSSMPSLTLINTYAISDSKTVILKARKEILDKSGKPAPGWIIREEGQETPEHDWSTSSFRFVLLSTDTDTPMPAGAQNRTDGIAGRYAVCATPASLSSEKLAAFGGITYTQPGIYHYNIRELKVNAGESMNYVPTGSIYLHDHLVYSGTAHSVEVRVTDDGKGKLDEPTVKYGTTETEPSVFHNQEEGEATLMFSAKKRFDGHPLEAGMFNFELVELVPKTAGDTTITVSDISWGELENRSLKENSKFSEMIVKDHGTIGAQGIVQKALEYNYSDLDRADSKKLYYAGREIKGTNTAVIYSNAVHFYEVTLTKTPGTGSNGVYVSKVKITDSTKSQFVTETEFEPSTDHTYTIPNENLPTQVNTYHASGIATINIQKMLEGRAWKEDDCFSFVLTGDDNNPIHVQGQTDDPEKLTCNIGNNDSDHRNYFTLYYTQNDLEGATTILADGARQKEFTYTIHETCMEGGVDKNPAAGGYTKNGITYAADQTVTLRVTDQNNGNLKLEYKNGDHYIQATTLRFTNQYRAAGSASATIQTRKQLTGRSWREGSADSFTFKIEPVSNTAGIAVSAMPLPKHGETAADKMTITGNSDTVPELSGGKEGSFDPITFTVVGEYIYEIEEVIPAESNKIPGVTYSSAERRVKVDVVDDLKGGLEIAKIHYATLNNTTPFAFVNPYTPAPVTVSFDGQKKVEGRQLMGAKYSFDLYETDSTFSTSEKQPLYNNTVSGEGVFKTHDITFGQTGTWYFVLKEHIPAGATADNEYTVNGIKYDTHDCQITVNVTDNPGAGKLKATVDYKNGSTFKNFYRASGEAQISVTKVLEGTEWGERTFEFKLTPGYEVPSTADSSAKQSPMQIKDGTVIKEVSELSAIAISGNPIAAFHKLYFDQSDIGKTYQYNLQEVLPEGCTKDGIYQNIQYDKKSYPVTVRVTDNEDGHLNLNVVYGESNQSSLTITNTWQSASFTGHKLWMDGAVQHTYESMSSDVTLKLYRNVEGKQDEEVTSFKPAWSGSGKVFRFEYDNLPAYDEFGKPYTYSVREASVSGADYVTTYVDNPMSHFVDRIHTDGTIINKKVGTTTITGTKVWPEGSGTHDNTKVPLEVWRKAPNGEMEKVDWRKEGSGITLSWNDNVYTFDGLAKYDSLGYEYTNYVAEEHYAGYVPVYHDAEDNIIEEYAPNGGRIVNIPEVSIHGRKIWDDGKESISHDNASEVHLTLLRLIKDQPGSLVELENAEPAWDGDFYYFHDLPGYDDSIPGHPVYTYMVVEEKIEGYEEPVHAAADGSRPVYTEGDVSFAYAPDGGTITNKRIPKEETPEPAPDPTARPASSNTFRFSFTKEWVGAAPQEISFMLYNPDGSAHPHRFNKKQLSATEWLYECWLSTSGDYYVIEDPSKEYRAKYVNYGSVADVTDRVYNGGKIINTNVPKTGDQSQPEVWVIVTALGLVGIALAIWRFRKPRK